MENRLPVVMVALTILLLAAVGLWLFWGNMMPAQDPPKAKDEVVAKPGQPPVKLSYRGAKVPLQGQVMGVNNTSENEKLTLATVFVKGKKEKDERSYQVGKTINPQDSVTVGWAELNGWKLNSGDKVRLKFREYEGIVEAEVP